MNSRLFATAAAICVFVSQPAFAADPDLKAARMGNWGYDMAGRNTEVAPSQDFFDHANGAFLDRLVIPADRTRYGSFDALRELSSQRMRAVVEAAAADKTATGDEARIGTLYRSFTDEAKVESLGTKPIEPALAAIRKARSASDIARLMGQSQRSFGSSIFGAYVYDDAKDPLRYATYLGQAGLGLPDRDYYLDAKFAPQKAKYEAYIAQILTLSGWENPGENAKAIVALETEIAQVSWTRAEQRDGTKTYSPVEVADLTKYAPGFDWRAFLTGAQMNKAKRVIVREKTALPQIATIYAKTPLSTLKAWTAFGVADQAAPYLPKAFDQARYEFRDKALAGQVEQEARWKRGVGLVDEQIGEALGHRYVETYFPASAKVAMQGLVGDILTAMKGRIGRVDWMGNATKGKALEKLSKVSVMIAYPDTWRDYSALTLKAGDLYGNVERAIAFEADRTTRRLNDPVDRKEWGMTPPTVNAYYSQTKNGIVFPAAILQPPFFDPQGDMAINYGAIGGVIGHEITHGFDDQGRSYDGDGRLTQWWTPEDDAKFKAKAAKLGEQYSAVEILPGAYINAGLTMGENIADLGGLLLALDAYHVSLKGQSAPVIDGLTGDQRVFLGWAQVWRGKSREERARKMLVADPHSPEQARVNVPVRNIDAFYEAFGVKPGDKMYLPPERRVRIW